MDSEFGFSCMMMPLLIKISQHFLLRQRRLRRSCCSSTYSSLLSAPIPYSIINRFTSVGMNDDLCYHLTRFTVEEIHQLLPLLVSHEIRFRHRSQATPEEAFAVVFIRLSYPIRYWHMMDRFEHSRNWLSIVFNDTTFEPKKQNHTKKGLIEARKLQSSRFLAGTLHYVRSYDIYIIDFMTKVYRNL